MRIFTAFLLASFSFAAIADLTYPVDVNGTKWQLIDTETCTTWGKQTTWWTYDGSEQPLPDNLKPLLVVEPNPLPDIDENLRRIESPWIICGPNTSLCYDTTTVHEDGVGCVATDTLQRVHQIVDLDIPQRRTNLNNIATNSMVANFDTDALQRDMLLFMSLVARLVNSETLPTNVQGINLQDVYTGVVGRLQSATEPNALRYFNLLDKVNDGTIVDSEMEQGWTTP